ncbi:permease [Ameyamaea chiangmaiensis NBRC 103196]|uniref:AI-2E family transporter n=1 Tax=Ameyamaea chiangmaiensis TaxID=442969 RepID=A0A850PBC7_9PROT|nr:AI-2E family transporter [Ameyamaea chiangmaiensis]MBS4074504.1 AI-2E family transporter [Ameyamaea chiangmaiensis]NVN39232.1 AI-2E family transporter [Ameyamaea chiangmaiensis]GBQ72287.1 permease [Ameyamaea chiangmaiensis NBRC 103196]
MAYQAPTITAEPQTTTYSLASLGEPHRSQRIARALLGLFFIVLGLYTVHGFIVSLVWGCVFAISSWPLYARMQRRLTGRVWEMLLPFLFTAAIALIFLVPLTTIGLEAAREAQGVLGWMQTARHDGVPLPSWVGRLPYGRAQVTNWWQENMADPQAVSDLLHSVDAGHSVAMTQRVGTQLAHRGMLFVMSIVTLFFVFKDGNAIIRQSLTASRRVFGKRGESIAQQIIASIHGTLAGLVLVGIAEGILLGIAYVIGGAPQPLLFGVVTAIAAMIPFLAIPTVGLACALILVKGATITAIVVFCFGVVVNFVSDHFIRPYLIGGSTQMPFLWVLLGILGGVETWGLLGLFLGPAALSVVHLLWRTIARERATDPGLDLD